MPASIEARAVDADRLDQHAERARPDEQRDERCRARSRARIGIGRPKKWPLPKKIRIGSLKVTMNAFGDQLGDAAPGDHQHSVATMGWIVEDGDEEPVPEPAEDADAERAAKHCRTMRDSRR